jgi:hypothetical protein
MVLVQPSMVKQLVATKGSSMSRSYKRGDSGAGSGAGAGNLEDRAWDLAHG